MTKKEMSLRWASQYDGPDALRDAARDRLLGGKVGGLAFGKTDEHPEDVIVALLESLSPDDWRQDAIVAAWGEARRRVDPLLEGLACERIPGELLDDAFARVFRVAERTGHERLRDGVFSDLQLAISGPDTSGIHVQQVVAAASACKPRESDRALWEPALEIEDIAAYAFQSLLRIRSARTQISEFLERLIRHQYLDDWDISVWFVAEFARTALGSDQMIVAVLQQIQRDDPDLWEDIKDRAPGDPCWSDRWVPRVEAPIFEQSMYWFKAFKRAGQGMSYSSQAMWTNPPRVLALEIARIKDKNPFELITAAMVHDIGMPMGDAKRHGRFIEYDLDVGTSFDQIRHLDFDRLIFNSDATKKRKIRV